MFLRLSISFSELSLRLVFNHIFYRSGEIPFDVDLPIFVSRSQYFVISEQSLYMCTSAAKIISQQVSRRPFIASIFG